MPSIPYSGCRAFRITRFVVGAIAATLACAFCYLEIDRPVAQLIGRYETPNWALAVQIIDALSACGLFVLALGLIFWHFVSGEQKPSQNTLVSAIASAVLAIACVELLKFVFARIGPQEYLTTGAYGFRYLSSQPSHSFPSEYGALAGSAATLLWTIVPSYRPTILLLALLLPSTQVLAGTHFASDVIAGLAIGALIFSCMREYFRRA